MNLNAKAFKGISHYKVSGAKLSPKLDGLGKSISEDLQNKRLKFNESLNTDEKIIKNQREVLELYNLENEYDDESRKSKADMLKYRSRYTSIVLEKTRDAHDVYKSEADINKALNLVQPDISTLATSTDRNKREYALDLIAGIKYGADAVNIRSGTTTPGIFWDIKRIWNRFKWGSKEDGSVENEGSFFKLNGTQKGLVKKLLNEPSEEMGHTLLYEYTYTTLPKIYPNISFKSHYFGLSSDRKYADIVSELKINDFFRYNEGDFLFAPFVFKPSNLLFPDHIVLIIFDRKAHQIQYYDPQALPQDHSDRTADGFNMLDKLNELKNFWNEKEAEQENVQNIEIVRNPIIHQEDIHNCGIYVCDAMKRRLKGESFEKLCIDGKNNEEITNVRSELAQDIMSEDKNSKIIREYDEEEIGDDFDIDAFVKNIRKHDDKEI